MFKWIVRAFKNVGWLLNHPPIGMTTSKETTSCSHCRSTFEVFVFSNQGGWAICSACFKAVMIAALEKDEVRISELLRTLASNPANLTKISRGPEVYHRNAIREVHLHVTGRNQ